MKILNKKGDTYILDDDNDIIATNNPKSPSNRRLSTKNCNELFGVVDVEDLANIFAKNHSMDPIAQDNFEYGFEAGYNTASMLNKEKEYTLSDLRIAFSTGKDLTKEEREDKFSDWGIFSKLVTKLKQPTEIEVEIEMEKIVDETKIIGAVKGIKGSGNKITTYKSTPKLDKEGCLILRKL